MLAGIGTTPKDALYAKVGQTLDVAMLLTMPENGPGRKYGHHLAILRSINNACQDMHKRQPWCYTGTIKTNMCGSQERKCYHVFCNTEHSHIIGMDE